MKSLKRIHNYNIKLRKASRITVDTFKGLNVTEFKTSLISILLNVIAITLSLVWVIGYFAYSLSEQLDYLLVLAVSAIIARWINVNSKINV